MEGRYWLLCKLTLDKNNVVEWLADKASIARTLGHVDLQGAIRYQKKESSILIFKDWLQGPKATEATTLTEELLGFHCILASSF